MSHSTGDQFACSMKLAGKSWRYCPISSLRFRCLSLSLSLLLLLPQLWLDLCPTKVALVSISQTTKRASARWPGKQMRNQTHWYKQHAHNERIKVLLNIWAHSLSLSHVVVSHIGPWQRPPLLRLKSATGRAHCVRKHLKARLPAPVPVPVSPTLGRRWVKSSSLKRYFAERPNYKSESNHHE